MILEGEEEWVVMDDGLLKEIQWESKQKLEEERPTIAIWLEKERERKDTGLEGGV